MSTKTHEITRRRFTVHDYHRMGEAGILHEDDRVELIEGEIVEMAASGTRHFTCVNQLTRLLVRGVGGERRSHHTPSQSLPSRSTPCSADLWKPAADGRRIDG